MLMKFTPFSLVRYNCFSTKSSCYRITSAGSALKFDTEIPDSLATATFYLFSESSVLILHWTVPSFFKEARTLSDFLTKWVSTLVFFLISLYEE